MKQVKGNQQLVVADDMQDTAIEADGMRAWYRQPQLGETPTAYKYFKLYVAQPVPRSIGRLAKHLRMERTGLARYSSKFKWLARAAAHDDFFLGQQLDRQRRQAEKRDLEWLERRDVQRNREWALAEQLLMKVQQMLAVPLFRETVTERLKDLDPDGRIIIEQIVTFEPLDWSAVDIARFFDIGSKIGRLAAGMDTDQKKIRLDLTAMTDEELEKLANQP